MSIIVVCPGCRKSFRVGDKFAGQTGPCPNCKRQLRVPTKEEEVKVHAPEQFAGGGKTTSGKLITKPIARVDTKLQPVMTALIFAAAVVVAAATGLGRWTGLFAGPAGKIAVGVGLLVLSPVLAVAAYSFLRDDELEPYGGKSLCIRATLCGLAYTMLWGIFTWLVSSGVVTSDLWTWLFAVPPIFLVGGLAAMSLFDLDFGNGVFHYGFYIIITVLLRLIAGLEWW